MSDAVPRHSSVIEARLAVLGHEIPPPQEITPGLRLTYRRLVRHGPIVYVAGHGPTIGTEFGYTGKVGRELTVEEGVKAAELTALNVLGTLRRELGGLDSVVTWLKVTGYVNAVPGFTEQARVVNGFSDLLLELYGPERLAARTSIGVPDLPFDMPVEVDAVLVWDDTADMAGSQ